MTLVAGTLVSFVAAPFTAVDALVLLAALLATVPGIAILVASMLFDPSAPRPYHLAIRNQAPLPAPPARHDLRRAA